MPHYRYPVTKSYMQMLSKIRKNISFGAQK